MMKYHYENDNTLRISLTFGDLADHEMQLIDFLTESDKVESLFFELVDELDLDERWEDPEVVTFQVRPHAAGIDLLVTDDLQGINDVTRSELTSQLEQFMKTVSGNKNWQWVETTDEEHLTNEAESQSLETLEPFPVEMPGVKQENSKKEIRKRKAKKEREPDFVYYTLKFEDFQNAVKLAKTVTAEFDETELYAYQGDYYMTVLDNMKQKGKHDTLNMRGMMLEYGEQAVLSRDQLREHAKVLLASSALETLKKI